MIRTPSRAAWAALAVTLTASSALAQGQPLYPGATVARPLYGDPARPDVSGVWTHDGSGRYWADPKTAPPPLTPRYAALHKAYEEAEEAGRPLADTASECKALGYPRIMTGPDPIEIIQTPGQITFIQQSGHEVRRIFIDGRGHPEDPDPAFDGHSVGHWNGDTLEIDVVAIRGETILDATGVPHSDQLTVKETWRLLPDGRIEMRATATDPIAFTKPWSTVHFLKRMEADYEMMEDICEDNNRNPTGADGRTIAVTK